MKIKNHSGMSLLEILVVVAIFAILGVLVTRSVLLTLRGSRRSESTLKVRENVAYALGIIERQLRNANSVTPCPNTDANVLTYLDQNGVSSSFSCVGVGSNDSYIASGSARLTSTGILIKQCSLFCSSDSNSATPAFVTINIQAVDSSSGGIENATVNSSTNIQLRNY